MDRKDYEEPVCPMDNSMWVEKKINPVPVIRIVEKLDYYMEKKDYTSAERHLEYWLNEAEKGNDNNGKLLICNEFMGFYRKQDLEFQAIEYAQKALLLVDELGLKNKISGATAYLNAGTVYKAFGQSKKAIEYFETAKQVYEKELNDTDGRKAGLYNNMALAFVDVGDYSSARELYHLAIDIEHEINCADEAITWLNLADCDAAQYGLEEAENRVQSYLNSAENCLDSVENDDKNGYFAYVCEKCAPVFDYYGYFMAAKKFRTEAENIYAQIN